MKKALSYALVGSLFFVVGVWYGYDKGVKNQLFFDAPAKLYLLNGYLEEGNSAAYVEGEVKYQLGLLEELKDDVSSALLNHPVHEGMKDGYQKYRPEVEELPGVKKARDEVGEGQKAR